ncbi:hypothetical protein AVEN_207816-1 [Araneus ventricosus]|uniref:Uncharacterized protein n=1 Tax=Araneus ventricosus TaxID=182803 RepID=A0A4Y2BZ91_ARAVE|nr:hypothetical protein AVEN_207816-1 [Araneus ventricosus]
MWLRQTSRRSKFILVDCGRLNSNSDVVPTARGLAKPQDARGSYLWTVVGGIRTVIPFLRRVAWPNLKTLEVRTCGLWSVEFEQ